MGKNIHGDHGAIHRRFHHHVVQVVVKPGQPVGEAVSLFLGLGQLCANFLLVFLVTLVAAQFEFRDLSLATADVADVFGYGRTQLRIGALKFQQAVAGHIALSGQITHAIKLFFQELKLELFAVAGFFQALVLLHQSGDIFVKGRQLAGYGGMARTEQLLLQADVVGDAGIISDAFQFGRKHNGLYPVALRDESRLRGPRGEILDADHFCIGF